MTVFTNQEHIVVTNQEHILVTNQEHFFNSGQSGHSFVQAITYMATGGSPRKSSVHQTVKESEISG